MYNFYSMGTQPDANQTKAECFSIFPCGYMDRRNNMAKPQQRPRMVQNISWVSDYIKSARARESTEALRAMLPTATRQEKQDFKILNFEYATFSGTFSYRNARSVTARTSFMTLDIDHLESTDAARELQSTLVSDTEVETALCFVSPSGLGVKWVVTLPPWTEGMAFRDQFEQLRRYVGFTYGIDPDPSGSDVCRACYLPCDPGCYVNPKYLLKTSIQC